MSILARARLAGRTFAASVLTVAATLSANIAAHAIDLDPITCNRPDSEPGDRYEVHDDGTCTFLGPRDPSAEPPGFVSPLAFRTPKVGRDRYRTSAVVAAKDFADASTIVLTSGRTLADAVSAGPLASRLHAPVVLVDISPACTSGFCVTLDAMPARGLLDDYPAIRGVLIVGAPLPSLRPSRTNCAAVA